MATQRRKRGFTLIELLIVISIIAVLASLGLVAAKQVQYMVRKKKSEDNLKQLYAFLTIYGNNFNCYPSMQPRGNKKSGGARDLYPLYLTALDKGQFLTLLQPPGVKLVPFTKDPGPDQFDKDHVGYVYNSTVVPEQSDNPPLMAERCVEDGVFTEQEKPVFRDCAHILMANGTIKQVPVLNNKLSLNDIKLEDLAGLQ